MKKNSDEIDVVSNPEDGEIASVTIEYDLTQSPEDMSIPKPLSDAEVEDVSLSIRDGILEALSDKVQDNLEDSPPEEDPRLEEILSDELISSWMNHENITLVEVPWTDPPEPDDHEAYSEEILTLDLDDTQAETVLMDALEESMKPSFESDQAVDEPPYEAVSQGEKVTQTVLDGSSDLSFDADSHEADNPHQAVDTIDQEANPKDMADLAIESNITFGKNPVDSIQEILSRNEKAYRDVHIVNERQKAVKSYYVPSFLGFFLALLVITTLLLYYTSTYI